MILRQRFNPKVTFYLESTRQSVFSSPSTESTARSFRILTTVMSPAASPIRIGLSIQNGHRGIHPRPFLLHAFVSRASPEIVPVEKKRQEKKKHPGQNDQRTIWNAHRIHLLFPELLGQKVDPDHLSRSPSPNSAGKSAAWVLRSSESTSGAHFIFVRISILTTGICNPSLNAFKTAG